MNESELRQILLDAEEPSRARQQIEWAKLRQHLFVDEAEEAPSFFNGWNLGLASLAAVVAVGITLFFSTSTPSGSVVAKKSPALVPVQVTLQEPDANSTAMALPVAASEETSQIVFASQEQPEITTTTFYSPEANADVIWLTNTGFVQE